MHHKHAHYAFFAGVILALLFGLFGAFNKITILILVILGVIVGFMNLSAKQVIEFLVATIALIVASGAANLVFLDQLYAPLGTTLVNMLAGIKVFVAPAAIVVSLKAIKTLAENK